MICRSDRPVHRPDWRSLDNFADAAVYGLALYAVGHSVKRQVRAAHVAGVLQLVLAVGVL